MITFSFTIKNPFAKDISNTYNVYKTISLTKHKTFEFQFSRLAFYNLFSFSLDLSFRGCDHAGPSLALDFFGWELVLKIYDNRHWDYDKGTWVKYDTSNQKT